MSRIFVSYSRADAVRIDELHRDLESLGHDAWLDRDLTGGQRWWDHILQSIRDCDTFVVALSSASLESRACQSELQYATALGKPVLPVLVKRDVSDGLMPPALAQLQRVDYTQADKAAFAVLNRGLTTMPAAPPLPAELPPEPEVPASYLFDLRTEIESTGALTPERQDELLTQLRARLDQGHAPADLRALAERFRSRGDVLARVDRELTEFEQRLAPAASATTQSPPAAQNASPALGAP
ncbi:MAG: toll/interleukin-1 receptor domain-containing protein, partial [Chloroflexi bacterium]|nr:toll/interleukin-1 receptor domain-containing protein [Chloroflexota bacterium]